MNKRILELAEQAGALEVKTVLNTPPAVSLNGDEIEKFAKLIIQECVAQCESVANMTTITNTGEMARKTQATAKGCAVQIKQYFGVEE